MQLKSGIYKITNLKNNKFYIGSSKNIKERFYSHRTELRRNNHANAHLQKSFNRNGEENFTFEIIEYCKEECLIQREQFYIDTLNPIYNIQRVAFRFVGYKFTREAKNKVLETKFKNGSVLLTEEIVKNIIKDINEKRTSAELGKKYNISSVHVTNIKYGTLWKHLNHLVKFKERVRVSPDNKKEKYVSTVRRLTESEVYEIFNLLKDGYSATKISRIFKINDSTICRLKQNKKWKHLINN